MTRGQKGALWIWATVMFLLYMMLSYGCGQGRLLTEVPEEVPPTLAAPTPLPTVQPVFMAPPTTQPAPQPSRRQLSITAAAVNGYAKQLRFGLGIYYQTPLGPRVLYFASYVDLLPGQTGILSAPLPSCQAHYYLAQIDKWSADIPNPPLPPLLITEGLQGTGECRILIPY